MFPLITELATATAAVAVITLGIEQQGRETVDEQLAKVGKAGFVLRGLLLGNVKRMGASFESESKLSSLLAGLSSVLDADEIPESGDVGLSCGVILSGIMHFGGRPGNK